jgi:FkbM family methyltransferase
MPFVGTIKFIKNHPYNSRNKLKSIINFFSWQIYSLLNKFPIVYPFTENSKLIIKKGMTGATGNLYCGLVEFEDMSFLLHFLRKDDWFIDIGANVGAYSILAAAEIQANVIAIEPIPTTFKFLEDNILINGCISNTVLFNLGIGSKHGQINFTQTLDTVNHVANQDDIDTILVDVKPLDTLLENYPIPILMKIDVEGYESEVLKGSNNTLINPKLKAIIIELNGSGVRYGVDENLVHDNLLNFGFKPYQYNPHNKTLLLLNNYGVNNTIYIRDLEYVKQRIETARRIKVGPSQKLV